MPVAGADPGGLRGSRGSTRRALAWRRLANSAQSSLLWVLPGSATSLQGSVLRQKGCHDPSMSTTLTTKSTVKLADAWHSEKQAFDFGAVLGLKSSRTTNGITYRAEAVENTVSRKGVAAAGLLGPYFELSKATGAPGRRWV